MHSLLLEYFTVFVCVRGREGRVLRVLLCKPTVTCQAATEPQPAHCCSSYCFPTFRVCTDTKHHLNEIHFKWWSCYSWVGGCYYVSVAKTNGSNCWDEHSSMESFYYTSGITTQTRKCCMSAVYFHPPPGAVTSKFTYVGSKPRVVGCVWHHHFSLEPGYSQ